jgi:hypothetical protein
MIRPGGLASMIAIHTYGEKMFPVPRTNLRLAQVVDSAIRLRSHHRQRQAFELLQHHDQDFEFIQRVLTCPHQRRAMSPP